MEIIWKTIPEFHSYEISNTGLVRSKTREVNTIHNSKRAIKGKILKPQVNYLGYLYVDLSVEGNKKRKTVHQLVFATFTDTFKYGQMVNHIDGNKENNCITNLEFSNHVHNNTHAHTLPAMPKQGKSKYRNVNTRIDKRSKNPKPMYVASVRIAGKKNYIGSFSREDDAARAVDAFLDKIGDTLRIRNFP